MPNGGSDCCLTCPFNGVNKGAAGYPAEVRGPFHCEVRGFPIDNPAYTYCNNHPRRNPLWSRRPRGPVWAALCTPLLDKPLPEGLAVPAHLWPPQGDADFVRVPYHGLVRPVEGPGGGGASAAAGAACAMCGQSGRGSIRLGLPDGPLDFCSLSHYYLWWLAVNAPVARPAGELSDWLHAAMAGVIDARDALARGDQMAIATALTPVDALLTHSGAATTDPLHAAIYLSEPELRGDRGPDPLAVEVALFEVASLVRQPMLDMRAPHGEMSEIESALENLKEALNNWIVRNYLALSEDDQASSPPLAVGVFVGDLLQAPGDVICTSTNPHLALMAGTGGAVRLLGGQEIQEQCDQHVQDAYAQSGRRYLPMGSARLTGAGRLPFRAIIHCVAIDAFHGSSPQTIAQCVRSALEVAELGSFREVAMPVFATGNGRFPYAEALQAMGSALQSYGGSVQRVWVVVQHEDQASEAQRLLGPGLGSITVRRHGE